MMQLWLLTAIDEDGGPWDPWYDKMFGFVVRAESEAQARELAAADAGDEARGKNPWLSPDLSRCVPLTSDGEAGIVLADFHAA